MELSTIIYRKKLYSRLKIQIELFYHKKKQKVGKWNVYGNSLTGSWVNECLEFELTKINDTINKINENFKLKLIVNIKTSFEIEYNLPPAVFNLKIK